MPSLNQWMARAEKAFIDSPEFTGRVRGRLEQDEKMGRLSTATRIILNSMFRDVDERLHRDLVGQYLRLTTSDHPSYNVRPVLNWRRSENNALWGMTCVFSTDEKDWGVIGTQYHERSDYHHRVIGDYVATDIILLLNELGLDIDGDSPLDEEVDVLTRKFGMHPKEVMHRHVIMASGPLIQKGFGMCNAFYVDPALEGKYFSSRSDRFYKAQPTSELHCPDGGTMPAVYRFRHAHELDTSKMPVQNAMLASGVHPREYNPRPRSKADLALVK